MVFRAGQAVATNLGTGVKRSSLLDLYLRRKKQSWQSKRR